MKIKYLISTFLVLGIVGAGAYIFKSPSVSETAITPVNTSNTNLQASAVTQPVAATQVVPNVAINAPQAVIEAPKVINVAPREDAQTAKAQWVESEVSAIKPQANTLNPKVLKMSLNAYQKAQKRGLTGKPMLTIIDYSKPSTEKRLWVIDLDRKKVLFNTLVAHGKNSGNVNSSSFSNRESSLKSSLGVFLTGDIYSGKHGNSLHVQGLEPGFNDKAYDRSIVFHGAKYVSQSIAKNTGRIGRSWGCMAVSEDVIQPLIKTIKNKSVVFAYYPDQKWLNTSAYLT